MKNNIKLSIIMPVYNEEAAIAQTVSGIKKQMATLSCEYEIIAVNDASQDKSKEILERINNLKIINHPVNKGYGASLKTGIKNSQYDWILIIDSDGTYPVNAIPKLISYTKNYDQVVGARDKNNNAIPGERKLAKKFLNHFTSYLVGKKISDLNSGLRIFKKEIVFKFYELFPEKFSFTSTMTMVCLSHGYDTKFISIDYYKRSGKSSIKATDFFAFIKLVTKLSLYFKPIKVFTPISLFMLSVALLILLLFISGTIHAFLDTTFIVLCATSLQTFFFGLLAEIFIHNK